MSRLPESFPQHREVGAHLALCLSPADPLWASTRPWGRCSPARCWLWSPLCLKHPSLRGPCIPRKFSRKENWGMWRNPQNLNAALSWVYLCSHTEQASAAESQATKRINSVKEYNTLIKNGSVKANHNQSKYYFLKIQHSARRKLWLCLF